MRERLKLPVRGLSIRLVIFMISLLMLTSFTQTWPPFLVVESSSMQHGDEASIGAIDTGDITLLQKSSSIITYVEGRVIGYSTYGDYGDVIIFGRLGWAIIHRPIMYIIPNGTGYDIPSLINLPKTEWGAFNASGLPANGTSQISTLWIRNMGWKHDLNITFRLDLLRAVVGEQLQRREGYVTMGDANVYGGSDGYDQWTVTPGEVLGRARGEIPYLGLITLMVGGLPWGDESAPSGSWFALSNILLFIVVILLVDFAGSIRRAYRATSGRLPDSTTKKRRK